MALLHFDGFTAYGTRGDLDSVYTREDQIQNLNVLPAGGPSEAGSILLGGVDTFNESGFFFDLVSSHDHIYLGFWFNYTDFDTTNDILDMIVKWTLNTTTVRASLHLGSDGHLELRRSETGTTHLDTSDALTTADGELHFLSRNTEYKIEIWINFVNTVGSFELRVNDEIWGKKTASADFDGTCDQIHFKTNDRGSGATWELGDMYVFDETGSFNNGFLGSNYLIETLRPTAEAAGIAFTPATGTDNSAMVDDAPKHDHDATENHSTGNAEVDRFTTGNTLAKQAVNAVKVINVARHEGASQNFRAKIFEGATGADGSDVALAETFEVHMEDFETNPDTSAQWTVTEIEASEFGYESRA